MGLRRYRWPDSVRDEVLARLLALNQQRADEERKLAPAKDKKPKGAKKPKAPARPRSPSSAPSTVELPFSPEDP